MLQAIDINLRINWSSSLDESEPKTIFVLKPLSGAEIASLGSNVRGNSLTLSGESIINLIDKSVVEIKNFNGFMDKKQIIESLPAQVINELILEIGKLNHLTKDDAKN